MTTKTTTPTPAPVAAKKAAKTSVKATRKTATAAADATAIAGATAAVPAAKAARKTTRAAASAAVTASPAQQSMLTREVKRRNLAPQPGAEPAASSASVGKKDVQKLQRAVVDGLEDVKAQDIVVFDTEHLSSLFERVVIASGTSNRQTKALAASVVDAVREAGFQKPRVEGEANGEWIIVDCGQVVVHVMQPNYRTYYNLEELWGEKPVRLKLGAAKPVAPAAPAASAAKATKPTESLRRSSAAKKGVEEAFPTKAQLKKAQDAQAAAAKKAAARPAAPRARAGAGADAPAKPRIRTLVVNAPTKPAGKKADGKPAARTPAKKTPKPATRKA